MTIAPKPFDPGRACPLLLVAPNVSPHAWEALANREHAVIAPLERAPTAETVMAVRESACRRFAVDAGRVFLIGAAVNGLGASISAETPETEPTAWAGLMERRTPPPPAVPTSLQIDVAKLRSSKGKVLAALYRSEKSFGKAAEALVALGTPTNEGHARVTFDALPPGEISVLLFHDENDNGKLDTGLFGVPKEGYGASNDPRTRMGPPRWRECRVLLTGAGAVRDLTISIRYL